MGGKGETTRHWAKSVHCIYIYVYIHVPKHESLSCYIMYIIVHICMCKGALYNTQELSATCYLACTSAQKNLSSEANCLWTIKVDPLTVSASKKTETVKGRRWMFRRHGDWRREQGEQPSTVINMSFLAQLKAFLHCSLLEQPLSFRARSVRRRWQKPCTVLSRGCSFVKMPSYIPSRFITE